ncbi:type II toxin-antitoxin system VapC family toxin [Qingshengfaniella alkalisoli]|uniref:Type II toxin-antitoxin system VapC family toxin n=1 Tax=Qingshengfaniella alkalisoli TaxID=2599296 RepID=A0A5B8J0S8_9RHOB|nr:type II toxin-antitoxin system VapC family toxin [Qingshengfaniella alkalisoli]QDY70781.1 type II toxin-antitoxin system VapC family toxin [Qingshengfaniella alkalisoli]
MPGFTETQIAWLTTAVNRSADFAKDAKREEEKSKQLHDILGNIDDLSEELREAQQFSVTWTEEKKKHFWSKTANSTKVVKKMEWSTGDRDTEVDTRHDLKDGFKVDEQDVRKVHQMHAKLLELQKKMEEATDADGNPLFTARDIERELWSPLVKANVIPSNAVADKYSQEAQVFNGACELYGERLKEHTKTASKHEKLKRGLSIAKDTVSLMGTVATQAISIANFDGVAMSQSEKNELTDLKSQDKAGTLDPSKTGRLGELSGKSDLATQAKQAQAYNTLAMGLANGAFDLADKSLDKNTEKRNWEIAEMAFNAVATAAVNSISADQAQRAVTDKDTSGLQSYKTATDAAKKLVSYSLAGSKVVFRFHDLITAPESQRAGIAKALIATVADAVGNAFAAFDVPKGKDKDGNDVDGTGGQWAKVGAYIATGIISAANAAEIAKMVSDAKASGKKIDPATIVSALGLTVVSTVIAGTFEPVVSSTRKTVEDDHYNTGVFEETEDMQSKRLANTTKEVEALNTAMKGANNLFAAFPIAKDIDPDAKRAELYQRNEDMEAMQREEQLKAYQKRLKDDDDFKRALEDDIANEVEDRQGPLMALIEEATQTPDDLADKEKAKRAMLAMDKLIAEANAVQTKWAVIDQLTSGGVGMVAKFVPGASIAVAVRQLTMDVAYLVKKSQELNLWMKNTALTYGNDSVYGPAITSRLASSQIQVSQRSLNVVFSMTGVTMESLRLADITGAATAGSIANSLARALSDYGYKMQKEAEISKGWKLYKKARSLENKGDRKLARKAMRWNSTLSKCVLAYGIVKDGDPVAKEAARNCGLSPEILQDQNDVCQKVVDYFMTVYSDDPVVMRRIVVPKDWHPGAVDLTLTSWVRFKAAAATKATPRLAQKSTKTPAIDKHFAKLDALCGKGSDYAKARDELGKKSGRKSDEFGTFLDDAFASADALVAALDAYIPVNDKPEGDGESWTENGPHTDMAAATEAFRAQAFMLRSEIKFDQTEREAQIEADEDVTIDDLLAS